MKIVIDISEDDYRKVQDGRASVSMMRKAIANGTPLDKIKTELHATAEMHEDGDYYLREEWIDEIFDEYKAESEDKK